MADLLYTGDRILIGAIASFAVICGFAAALLAAAVYGAVCAIRRRPRLAAAQCDELLASIDTPAATEAIRETQRKETL